MKPNLHGVNADLRGALARITALDGPTDSELAEAQDLVYNALQGIIGIRAKSRARRAMRQ